jgi:hypothetical protein
MMYEFAFTCLGNLVMGTLPVGAPRAGRMTTRAAAEMKASILNKLRMADRGVGDATVVETAARELNTGPGAFILCYSYHPSGSSRLGT